MAGKSTILRCAASVALLASCGLHAPAKAARVRRFDSIVLRAFASDAPAHGRSSFAVEMDEMRAVLAGASARSLILVDELGKGTEAAAGAALAGAMLEALAARGCTGVFGSQRRRSQRPTCTPCWTCPLAGRAATAWRACAC